MWVQAVLPDRDVFRLRPAIQIPELKPEIKGPVRQIKLGTGISEKYFNLEPFSSISIKPVSSMCNIVQLMQQGWTAVFEPTRIDYATNTLVGSLYSDHLPETKDLLSLDICYAFKIERSDTYECFKPKIGEVVACEENQKFMRGQMLGDGRVVLVDLGRTAKPTNYRRLNTEFAYAPHLAASLSMGANLDMDLLNQLSERNAFTVTVSAQITLTQSVKVIIDDNLVEAELQRWLYNPMTCPDTLMSGDRVRIIEWVCSNSLIVMPADMILRPIQCIHEECVQPARLMNPPEVGFNVGYHVKGYSYKRSIVVKTDSEEDEYELYNYDYGTHSVASLNRLCRLTNTCKLPFEATRINLKDVDKVDKMDMTKESLDYLNSITGLPWICDNFDVIFRIKLHSDNTATLVRRQIEKIESVNETLADLLKPIIIPDINGKLTLRSLTLMKPPLHQQVDVLVTQTEPLHVQIKDHAKTYYIERFHKIQVHCYNIQEPYSPCQTELCFAKYEDCHWYRAVCVEEGTDLTLMLVDYGNIFYASKRDIRKMDPEFLDFPVLGLACRIIGLPTELSHEQKEKLEKLLPVDRQLKVTFEAEEEDKCYHYISIPFSSLLS